MDTDIHTPGPFPLYKKLDQEAKATASPGCWVKLQKVRHVTIIPGQNSCTTSHGSTQTAPSRTPLKVLFMQPCSVTCLACWLRYSPWKNIFPYREYFSQVVFSALFLQPAEAMSVARSFVETKPSLRRNFWVIFHIHLGSKGDTHCAWTRGNTWSLAAATFASSWSSSFPATDRSANADRINLPFSISQNYPSSSETRAQTEEERHHPFPFKYSKFQGIIEANKIVTMQRVKDAISQCIKVASRSSNALPMSWTKSQM